MRLCSGRPPTRRHGRGGRQLCGLCRNQDAEFVDKNLTKHRHQACVSDAGKLAGEIVRGRVLAA